MVEQLVLQSRAFEKVLVVSARSTPTWPATRGERYRVTQVRKEHSTHYLVELIGQYGRRSKIAKGEPHRHEIIRNLKHAIKYGRVHI